MLDDEHLPAAVRPALGDDEGLGVLPVVGVGQGGQHPADLEVVGQFGEPRRVVRTPESPFGTRSHDRAVVLVLDGGEADLVTSATGTPERLVRGDAVLIPAGRVYGIQAVSPECRHLLYATDDDIDDATNDAADEYTGSAVGSAP